MVGLKREFIPYSSLKVLFYQSSLSAKKLTFNFAVRSPAQEGKLSTFARIASIQKLDFSKTEERLQFPRSNLCQNTHC